METIKNMELWLRSAETDPIRVSCICEYARGRGGRSMQEVCRNQHIRYRKLGQSQDKIGWRRFTEGCVSKEVVQLQMEFAKVHGMKMSMAGWASGLITKLLKVTHGQWIYRNLLVHEKSYGVLATKRKEELQTEIQKQQELGVEGLADKDKFLLEIRLEDLEESSGEQQAYWLLAIKAARAIWTLRRRRQERQDNTAEATQRDG